MPGGAVIRHNRRFDRGGRGPMCIGTPLTYRVCTSTSYEVPKSKHALAVENLKVRGGASTPQFQFLRALHRFLSRPVLGIWPVVDFSPGNTKTQLRAGWRFRARFLGSIRALYQARISTPMPAENMLSRVGCVLRTPCTSKPFEMHESLRNSRGGGRRGSVRLSVNGRGAKRLHADG